MKKRLFLALLAALPLSAQAESLGEFAGDGAVEIAEATIAPELAAAGYLPGSLVNRKTKDEVRLRCGDEKCTSFSAVLFHEGRQERTLTGTYRIADYERALKEKRADDYGPWLLTRRGTENLWSLDPGLFFFFFPIIAGAAIVETAILPYAITTKLLTNRQYHQLKKMMRKRVKVGPKRFARLVGTIQYPYAR